MDPTDQSLFASKLWQIAHDYEDELRQEERGWKLEKQKLMNRATDREYKLKLHHQFRIEALESALVDVKLGQQQELERMAMQMNDLES